MNLAKQRAVAPLILCACQQLQTDAATEPQGDRTHRRRSPLQFVAVVTGQSLENSQDVDVAIRSCIPAGFGAKEDTRMQACAVGCRQPVFEFIEHA